MLNFFRSLMGGSSSDAAHAYTLTGDAYTSRMIRNFDPMTAVDDKNGYIWARRYCFNDYIRLTADEIKEKVKLHEGVIVERNGRCKFPKK